MLMKKPTINKYLIIFDYYKYKIIIINIWLSLKNLSVSIFLYI